MASKKRIFEDDDDIEEEEQASSPSKKLQTDASTNKDSSTVRKLPFSFGAAPTAAKTPATAKKGNTASKKEHEVKSAPVGHVNQNKEIVGILRDLGAQEKAQGEPYRASAYFKAAKALANHSVAIKSGHEAKNLPGVGEKIAKKIQEIIDTGKLNKFEENKADPKVQALTLLTKIWGVGPAAANRLVQQGITTLDQLRKSPEKLNDQQRIGLRYFDEFESKIPRSEMDQLNAIVQQAVHELGPKYQATPCGSYRRGAGESGDIDILLMHADFLSTTKDAKPSKYLTPLVKALQKIKFITDDLSFGDVKYMGVCRLPDNDDEIRHLHRRIDIRLIPADQFFPAVLYFTGSDFFNKQMRQNAIQKGFTLNEYTLKPVGVTGVHGHPVPVHSEEDIFEWLQIPYTKPEDRSV